MNNYTDKKEYLENLSSLNKLVAHNRQVSEGSEEKRVSFIPIEDEEGLSAAVANTIHFPCVVMMDLSGRLRDLSGSIRKEWSNTIWFLHKAQGVSEHEKKRLAYELSETVMNQFISKMLNDFEEEGSCGPFRDLSFNDFFFQMTGDVEDGIYGWRLSFPDQINADDITVFDNTKWHNE